MKNINEIKSFCFLFIFDFVITKHTSRDNNNWNDFMNKHTQTCCTMLLNFESVSQCMCGVCTYLN